MESSFRRRQISNEQDEPNIGPFPKCPNFDPKTQFVDVRSGSGHEYRPAGPSDKRGPCPGLNAAANHGFINRTGITTILEAATGVQKAFGMDIGFSTLLSALGVSTAGDPLAGTWSIGEPYSPSLLWTLLGQKGRGLSDTHNIYEGDGSGTRSDAYMSNPPDGASLNITRFTSMYNKITPDGTMMPTHLRVQAKEMHDDCVHNNGRCFFPPPAFLVAAAASQFPAFFMSNYSAEDQCGYLSQDILKSFFGIRTKADNTFEWVRGTERIPDNWYKRPTGYDYGLQQLAIDALYLVDKYPDMASFAGNTGKPNTFTPIDIADLSGGTYNAQTLLQGNNLACFVFQAFQSQMITRFNIPLPTLPVPGMPDLKKVLDGLLNTIEPILAPLDCPELRKYDEGLFGQFPGAK